MEFYLWVYMFKIRWKKLYRRKNKEEPRGILFMKKMFIMISFHDFILQTTRLNWTTEIQMTIFK